METQHNIPSDVANPNQVNMAQFPGHRKDAKPSPDDMTSPQRLPPSVEPKSSFLSASEHLKSLNLGHLPPKAFPTMPHPLLQPPHAVFPPHVKPELYGLNNNLQKQEQIDVCGNVEPEDLSPKRASESSPSSPHQVAQPSTEHAQQQQEEPEVDVERAEEAPQTSPVTPNTSSQQAKTSPSSPTLNRGE